MRSNPLPSYSEKLRPFRPEVLTAPRDFVRPDACFDGQSRPIMLEIGAGVGLHALTFARAHPEMQVLAIERTAEKFDKFYQSYLSDALTSDAKSVVGNIMPIHADAIPWVVHALPPASVQQVFILYPNPEPKNASQRWFNMPFMQFLLSRMQPHATLTIASNIEDYLNEVERQLLDIWQLPYVRTLVTDERRTHFEIKYLTRGEVCGQIIVTKPMGYTTAFDAWAF